MKKEEIVEILEESKNIVLNNRNCFGLCYAISEVLFDKGIVDPRKETSFYRSDTIRKFIPEFTPSFFGIDIPEDDKMAYWWDKWDKEIRIEALNKLIKLYS